MMPVIYITEFLGLCQYQVAGLTNNSCIAEAHAVRHCVQEYKFLGKYVLKVAKVITKHLRLRYCHHIIVCSPNPPTTSFLNTVMACIYTSYRRDWMKCYTLVLLRSTKNLPRCLQMWLVLRLYHSLTHQTLAWTLLIIQVSVGFFRLSCSP